MTVTGDVRDSEVLKNIVDTAIEKFGKINILVSFILIFHFSLKRPSFQKNRF